MFPYLDLVPYILLSFLRHSSLRSKLREGEALNGRLQVPGALSSVLQASCNHRGPCGIYLKIKIYVRVQAIKVRHSHMSYDFRMFLFFTLAQSSRSFLRVKTNDNDRYNSNHNSKRSQSYADVDDDVITVV